jgi:hypothetical protein
MAPATDLTVERGLVRLLRAERVRKRNKVICFKLNKGPDTSSGKTGTFWFDGTTYYDADPTVVPEPVAPRYPSSPPRGHPLRGSITLSYTEGTTRPT